MDDALLCIRNGVDGIWISNHGARQLDTTPATIEVLPEIARAVNGRMEIYIDGGVTRGTDALKVGTHHHSGSRRSRGLPALHPILWGWGVHMAIYSLRPKGSNGSHVAPHRCLHS